MLRSAEATSSAGSPRPVRRDAWQADREKILLVDTRQEWEHRAGHIAESVNFPLEPTWWAGWQKKGDLKTFLGPDKEKPIVFF